MVDQDIDDRYIKNYNINALMMTTGTPVGWDDNDDDYVDDDDDDDIDYDDDYDDNDDDERPHCYWHYTV